MSHPNSSSYIFRSRSSLWRLFLWVSLPTHFWALIVTFRDLQSIAARTNWADAAAFTAYILLFALGESLLVFVAALLADLLLPRRWSQKQHVLALGLISFVSAFWMILRQLNFWSNNHAGFVLNAIDGSAHPMRWGALVLLAGVVLVALSVAAPLYLVNASPGFRKWLWSISERIVLLSTLYLALDAFSIVFILYRNLV